MSAKRQNLRAQRPHNNTVTPTWLNTTTDTLCSATWQTPLNYTMARFCCPSVQTWPGISLSQRPYYMYDSARQDKDKKGNQTGACSVSILVLSCATALIINHCQLAWLSCQHPQCQKKKKKKIENVMPTMAITTNIHIFQYYKLLLSCSVQVSFTGPAEACPCQCASYCKVFTRQMARVWLHPKPKRATEGMQ